MSLVDRVWFVAGGPTEARPPAADAFGAKAASLARLARAGLRVPPAVALERTALAELEAGAPTTDAIVDQVASALEQATGTALDGARPLVLAVRSSPLEDRPGLLPTYLDVGATRSALPGLIARLGRRAALGVRRRWLATLAVDLGITNPRVAADVLRRARREQATRAGLSPLATDYELERALPDAELDEESLEAIVRGLEDLVVHPEPDARASLARALVGIARVTRERLGALDAGCVIQEMVFGNRSERSGTGVATSRAPDGAARTFVEIARAAQGLDADLRRAADASFEALTASLEPTLRALEREERAPVDVEIVVVDDVVSFVQHRPSALGPAALARATVSLVRGGVLTREEALLRVPPDAARELFATRLADEAVATALARGLGASPGLVTGVLAVRPARAAALAAQGQPVILARTAPSTDEVPAMRVAAGILTARGGLTCHAAVIARALRRPAVVGCTAVEPNDRDGVVRVHTRGETVTLHEGALVTVDGTTGAFFSGRAPVRVEPPSEETLELFAWADEVRGVPISACAEDEATETLARQLGVDSLVSPTEASRMPAAPADAEGWRSARAVGAPVLARVEDVPRARLEGARAALHGRFAPSATRP